MLKVLILLMLSTSVFAETVVHVSTFSYHQNRAANYNESNYGVGIRHYSEPNNYITVGTYKNSEFGQSVYAGMGKEYDVGVFKLGYTVGAITGYRMYPVLPYAVLTARYKALTLVISPLVEPVVLLNVDLLTF